LLPKLAVFGDEINKRNVVAANYTKALKGVADRVPEVLDGVVSTWAQYTIEVPDPFAFAASLKEQGIPTARYYPKPVHVQSAYSNYPVSNGALPNTMACIDHIISLPMHPYLTDEDQGKVIEAAKAALA
jgi:dTDP-4-amino-4,6-dideoxygalactose transaminase